MKEEIETQSDLFDDEELFNGTVTWFIIYAVLSLVIIFLIGWLVFGHPWKSLLVGFLSFIFFFYRALKLSMGRNAYLEFIEENANEASEEVGMNKEKAEAMMKRAAKILEKAENSQPKT